MFIDRKKIAIRTRETRFPYSEGKCPARTEHITADHSQIQPSEFPISLAGFRIFFLSFAVDGRDGICYNYSAGSLPFRVERNGSSLRNRTLKSDVPEDRLKDLKRKRFEKGGNMKGTLVLLLGMIGSLLAASDLPRLRVEGDQILAGEKKIRLRGISWGWWNSKGTRYTEADMKQLSEWGPMSCG